MQIGVLSDTHIPSRTKKLPDFVMDTLNNVDYIIHAGDINDKSVINALERLAPVIAVSGNTDTDELKQALGELKIFTLGRMKFGLCHGHGVKGNTLGRVVNNFKHITLDCIIFGHSHIPYCEYIENTLFFNPGSPTDKRRNELFSFGILEIESVINPRIIYFN